MIRATVFALVLALPPAGAAAAAEEEGGRAAEEGWRGSLTLGVGGMPDYEGSDDYEVMPVPMSRLEWRGFGFHSQGSRALLDVLPSHRLMGGPLLNYRLARDDVEDARVDALPDVDGAIEAGAFFAMRLPTGDDPRQLLVPTLSFLHDVSGAHDGWLVTGDLSNTFVLMRPLALNVGGSVTWASENYRQTYFGVSPTAAAASGLAPHDAGAGFRDVALRATLDLYVSRSWSLGPTLIYRRLLGEAADSPVVEDAGSANQFIGFLSATWRF